MTILVFVEFPEHVAEAAALAAREGAGLIAMTPHVAQALDDMGVAYQFPEDHFHWQDIEEDGIGFLADFQRLLARLDEILAQRLALDLSPVALIFYESLLLLGSLWPKVYRIAALLDAVRPSRVHYFDMPVRPFDPDQLADDALHGGVAELCCAQAGISFVRVERPVALPLSWGHRPAEEPAMPRWRASARRRWRSRLAGVVRKGWAWLSRRTLPRLLVAQSPVGKEPLLGRAEMLWWPDASAMPPGMAEPAAEIPDAISLRAGLDQCLADPQIRSFFRLKERDWLPLALRRLEHVMLALVPRAVAAYGRSRAVLAAARPDALLLCHLYGLDPRVMALAARGRGVPVICEPHGPYGHYVNHVFPLVDSMGCSHYLVGGPGAVDYTQRHCPPDMKLVVTGAAMMDQATGPGISRRRALSLLGLDPSRPVVVVAIQPVSWSVEYPPYVVRDDRTNWVRDKRILEAVGARPDVQIILKGHPGTDYPLTPLAEFGRRAFGARFRYVATWPFMELLDTADAFVLGYAVTTIYQALARRRRVYVCNDYYPIDPPHRALLENAAYCADSLDEFLPMLEADISSGAAFEESGKDHMAFRRRFTCPGADGTNRARIVDAILAIAAGTGGQPSENS